MIPAAPTNQPTEPPLRRRSARPSALDASKWCPGTCDKCSNPCGLLANHGSGHRCRAHFV